MPRLLGINIPENKKILYSMTYLYGIGQSSSEVILRSANVDGNKLAKDLTVDELNKIQKIIEKSYKVEGDLRKDVGQNKVITKTDSDTKPITEGSVSASKKSAKKQVLNGIAHINISYNNTIID